MTIFRVIHKKNGDLELQDEKTKDKIVHKNPEDMAVEIAMLKEHYTKLELMNLVNNPASIIGESVITTYEDEP